MEALLEQLEHQIRKLLEQQDHLKKLNQTLTDQQYEFREAQESLRKKQAYAIEKIGGLISHLKSMES